jgi:nitroreductase/NAD-dependent dihydropyrimidine dehydrogenase PreA subunit
MVKTTFDLSVCTRCGLCTKVCPAKIITLNNDKSPTVTNDVQERCIVCGHCEALCPVHAISVIGDNLIDAVATFNSAIAPEQFESYCLKRRSIRSYKKEPVDHETIEHFLDIGRYAPSGGNRHTVEWTVLYTPEIMHTAIDGTIEWMRQTVRHSPEFAAKIGMPNHIAAWEAHIDSICRGAPHCIVAHAHKDDVMGLTDGVIALSHIELAAPSFGVGACWGGYLYLAANAYPQLKDSLGIPSDHTCSGALMFGYPAITYAGIPKRKAAPVVWK